MKFPELHLQHVQIGGHQLQQAAVPLGGTNAAHAYHTMPVPSPSHCLPQTSWGYQDQLGANPTYNCSTAYSTDAYDYYTSTSSYLNVQNSSNYVKNSATNKWAWVPSSCTTGYTAICEVPTSAYPCPPSPPPATPPPPPLDLCKQRVLGPVMCMGPTTITTMYPIDALSGGRALQA